MKILGLDLGTTSIGWALIETDEKNKPLSISGLGSRIIPYSDDNIASDFTKGKGDKTPCSERTRCRQMRRNIDRFQLHREQLRDLLEKIGMIDSSYKTVSASPVEVWKARAEGAKAGIKLPLEKLAGVLFHINHRRGYKHAKSDLGDPKQTDYVAKINDRYKEIIESGKTVGQYFYDKLKESEVINPNGKRYYTYRVKEKICPRAAYEEEMDRILHTQSEFYPDILTEENIGAIKQTVLYQRPLKSCKNLVSFCEFESHEFLNKSGKKVQSGPKVTPRTSPLEQVCRIYEAINNIRLVNSRRKYRDGDCVEIAPGPDSSASRDLRKSMTEYILSAEERERVFEYMNTHEKITEKELLKLLGLTVSDGFKSDKSLGKGIQGNTTRCQIERALGDYSDKDRLLQFDIEEESPENPEIDKSTGEVLPRISVKCFNQPLYMLWHTLYSIDDKEELFEVLSKKFGIDDAATLNRLYALDFVKAGYANKSAKFIRKLLPLLKRGMMYSEACETLGISHSASMTKEEKMSRKLQARLDPIQKGELRQPVVEKILNQTVRVVNSIIDKYGEIDEVRVELARELKRDKEGRDKMWQNNSKNERENKALSDEIAELNILPTRRRIQKLKMLKETDNRCMYCGKGVTPYQFIEGHGYDIEHIIPRSRLFDDSFTNKVCACRECNAAKGARTAFDFMKSRGEQEFNSYLDRVETLYKSNKISRGKRDRLLMTATAIPTDFIDRDLRETQYISKKSMEILSKTIRNVYASSGMVTDFFRHAWGYDTILHDINFPRYEEAGLTERVEYETHGQKHSTVRIKDWSKRKDHRHHALDALVVALTRQGYIQRLNTLNGRDDTSAGDEEWRGLNSWAAERPHIERGEVIKALERVSVSFKAGKKLTTPGKRYIRKNGKRVCVQRGVTVPRSPLHKDTIYGRIKVYDGRKKLKYALQYPELIKDPDIREKLQLCLRENEGDIGKALKTLKKMGMEIDGKNVEEIECYREEVVVKYKIESIVSKDVKFIVDAHIRKTVEDRFAEVGNKDKDFQKSLTERPLYSDKEGTRQIRTIRLFTGYKIEKLAGVRRNESGEIIGYAQKQNNHHTAFYRTAEGKIMETTVSFWDCVKRRNCGIAAIVTDPTEAWEKLASIDDNDTARMIADTLPPYGSEFVMSLQRNEMVVLGMSDDEWNDAVATRDARAINRRLYCVWKLRSGEYCFKYQTNTTASIEEGDKELKQFMITSISSLLKLQPRKVKVSILGEIILPDDDKEGIMF